jgi:hypothetical protein
MIEVADDADALRVRRPDGEVNAGDRADAQPVRAELVPRAVVRAFAHQVEVEVAEDLSELVRVGDVPDDTAFVQTEFVCELMRRPSVERHDRLEQPFGPPPSHRNDAGGGHQLHG